MTIELLKDNYINTTKLIPILKGMGKVNEEEVESRVESIKKNPNHLLVVAVSGDEYLGYAWVQSYGQHLRTSDITARFHDLYVVESARGQGLAKMLFEEVKKWSKDKGVKYLEWQASKIAVGFYQKLGYEPDYESDLKDHPFFEIEF